MSKMRSKDGRKVGDRMINILKTKGCDECMNDKAGLYTLTVGQKKITLCEKCMRELLRVTEEYVDRLDRKAVRNGENHL